MTMDPTIAILIGVIVGFILGVAATGLTFVILAIRMDKKYEPQHAQADDDASNSTIFTSKENN